MKKLLLICLMLVMVPLSARAGTWCQWDGSAGTNCQTTSATYIIINGVRVTIDAENLNPRGWYELFTTEPTIGTDQIKDEVVWSFVDNEIFRTWTVRDMTAEEIDARDASAMEIGQFYLWKTLLTTGIITVEQAQTFLPPELIASYQARSRLLNP